MEPKTDVTTDNNDANAPKTSPPSVGPTYDKALVYDGDGKLWKDKFLGREGHVQQVQKQLEEAQKQYEQSQKQLQAELTKREGTIEQLNGKLSAAGEQLGELQGLKDRIPELETKAGRAAKLEAILEYPKLATMQVTDMVKTEDGEEVEMLVNPVMNLVQNTSLEGDALRAELRRLNSLYSTPSEPSPPQNTGVTDGAAPSPGEPVEQTPEYWEEKAREAHRLSIEDPSNVKDHQSDMIEYSMKAREARAKLQS